MFAALWGFTSSEVMAGSAIAIVLLWAIGAIFAEWRHFHHRYH